MGIAQCPSTATPLSCPAVVACVTSQPTGAPAVAGDLVLGKDGQYHALPAAAPFATPAETIAGTATNLIVSPADLTAKLANQPAAGSCTDREDVVWNGTILKGAAKHYSFSGSFVSAYLTQLPSSAYVPISSDTTINNPSNCRTLRVTVRDLASRLQSDSASVSGNLIQGMSVTVSGGGVQYAIGAEPSSGVKEIYHSGSNSVGYGPTSGFYDIPPSASATFTVSEYLVAGGLNFISSGVHGASASFIAQTL